MLNIMGIQYFSGTQKKLSRRIIKELEYVDDFVQKLKNEYTKQIKEFEDKIKDLESKIDLQSKKRQITDEQVQQIKALRAKGLSYRAIQNQTGWSSVTINRALNGIYD